MDSRYMRKKEPELVRQALLDNAARIAAKEGFAAVTLQTVAQASNVTKGGLIHHFASKQALVEGMFLDQLRRFEMEIENFLAYDKVAYGRFTRAYVSALFDKDRFGAGSAWTAMAATVTADRSMRAVWSQWMARRLKQHSETDSDAMLETVRLAADGAWFNYLLEDCTDEELASLKQKLAGLTMP